MLIFIVMRNSRRLYRCACVFIRSSLPLFQVACIQLVNAVISTAEDLDLRLHLRNEILRTGMNDLIEVCGLVISLFYTEL